MWLSRSKIKCITLYKLAATLYIQHSYVLQVVKILGPKSARLKGNLIKLLKDDSEEVLQGLIPRVGLTLECLVESQTIGTDKMVSKFHYMQLSVYEREII